MSSLPVSWNTPAWSLSCEVFFYLCFPLCAVAEKGVNWRGALAIAGAACILPGVMHAAGVPEAWKPAFHVAEFMMGIVTARAVEMLLQSRRRLTEKGRWFYIPASLQRSC